MHLIRILFAVVCTFSFVRSTPLNSRIINGTESKQPHPWVARIVIDLTDTPKGQKITSDCGGSLIASKWILTAKHCLLNNETQPLGNPANYEVFLGENYWPKGKQVKVVDHFFYSTENYIDDDISLLKLQEAPVGIDPIPIRYEDIANDKLDGQLAQLYGWGLTKADDSDSATPQLRETKVQLYTDNCKPTTLCFDPKVTNTNSCEGDSGGPMTLNLKGVETLVGVTHVGQILNNVPCSGHFSSYTKTFYGPYAAWIQDTMEKNSE